MPNRDTEAESWRRRKERLYYFAIKEEHSRLVPQDGSPLQDSCLENPMDRGAWQTTVHGVAKSRTTLND